MTNPDYIWSRARVLAADVAVAADTAAALLPAALLLSDPPRATIFVADYPDTSFGSAYREAAILLHVEDRTGPALHCPWMAVDDDGALILGREMLGFPKKLAEIRIDERGSHLVGSAVRKGTRVLRIEATLGEEESDPTPLFARRIVNAVGTPATGMQLIELPPVSEAIHAARRGPAAVQLTSSERDPLGLLEAGRSGTARFVTLSFGDPAAAAAAPPRLLGAIEPAWVNRQFFARAL